MAPFADDKLEEVRNRTDIVQVIGAHVRLRRAGRNFVGLCPFHQEKTPSFSVNAERGFFHCFGCGAGGSVFNFVMRLEGLNFPEAVRSLAQRCGVSLPEHDEDGTRVAEREMMRRAAQVGAEFFAHVLWKTPDGAVGREYLNRRSISEATAREFMLGYAPARPSSLAKALEKRGLLEAGLKIGLAKRNGTEVFDMFRARLMFPIRDPQGRVLAFGGRVLDQRLPKYINSPESPLYSKARNMYGLYEARKAIAKSDRGIVVEGYIDVIALWQTGFQETVASLGTALTVEQLRLLSRHTRNVFACFDGDSAGHKASLRALNVFLEAGLLGRGIFIPSGFDPDTLVKERGAQAFNDLIASAELLVDYFLRVETQGARGSLSGQARAAERVAEVLRLVGNEFEFNLLARKASELLGVSEELLRRHARPNRTGGGQQIAPAAGSARPPGAQAAAELGLIGVALCFPELRAELGASDPSGFYEDPALAQLLNEIIHSSEGSAQLEALLEQQLSDEQRSRLSALMVGAAMEDLEAARKLGADYFKALARGRERREVQALRDAVKSDQRAEIAQAVIALRQAGKAPR